MSQTETILTLIQIAFLCYVFFLAGQIHAETKEIERKSAKFRQDHEAWCAKMGQPTPKW